MTNKILDDILDALEMDEDRKKTLMAMPTEELLIAIFGVQQYLRSEIATIKKRQILSEQDAKKYRAHRERKEQNIMNDLDHLDEVDENHMSITQKMMVVAAKEVAKAFSQRFDFWTYFRDRVLPTLITGFILGLLYLVYGQGGP